MAAALRLFGRRSSLSQTQGEKDTSPNFWPPPGALDAEAQAVCVGSEPAFGWAVCVYCLRWPFRNYRGDLTRSLAAKSSYLPCSDTLVGMVTCSVCFRSTPES